MSDRLDHNYFSALEAEGWCVEDQAREGFAKARIGHWRTGRFHYSVLDDGH